MQPEAGPGLSHRTGVLNQLESRSVACSASAVSAPCPQEFYETAPVVGDFNSDTKPDIVYSSRPYNSNDATIVELLNTTANGNWGGCAYPGTGLGIRVCAPGSTASSPVAFNAAANSYGQLRKMELWVDGHKVAEQFHTWGPRAYFNLSQSFSSGSHRGVMFAADIDNRLQENVFYFNVGGTCVAPSSAEVNICAPVNGSTVNSRVQVEAAAKVNGTFTRMELWVDGVKKYTSSSSTLNTSVTLGAGNHRFAVIAINTAGQKWESAVSATVK